MSPDQLDAILSSQSRARTVTQVAVSPDGKRVAWLQAGEIRVASLDNLLRSQEITGQSCAASEFVWSPNSASIAFLSDCDESGQPNLFLSHLDSSAALRLTDLHGYVNAPAFSPDSRSIAFLYVEGATRPAGALAAEPLPSGVIGEDHIEIQRVAAISAELSSSADRSQPAAPGFLTPPNLHIFEFDWSPDSRSLAYIAADPPGENNWWVAKLYTQSIAFPTNMGAGAPGSGSPRTGPSPWGGDPSRLGTGGSPTPILSPSEISGPLHGLQIALPRWSPDGKSIAFIGGLMSDQGVTGGDVWITPAEIPKAFACGQLFTPGGPPPACGPPFDLTPGRPTSAQWIAWGDNRSIYVNELSGGISQLVRLLIQGDPNSGNASVSTGNLIHLPGMAGAGIFENSLSATADRSLFVFASSSFDSPPEIFAARTSFPSSVHSADIAPLVQLSHFNTGLSPSWGHSVSLAWKNDSFNIQGWLLLPEGYDPSKKYPLIVEVHGGPAASVQSSWAGGAGGFSATVFSALGYFVLMANPRGSYGQGEAFTQANRKNFGYGDLRDILAGVDAVLAQYPVDPSRVGIAGWSYGGFMSMFAVTQTHRFRAAVDGAGISDWLSYYGENSIDQWMIPYFGASVYDDPQIYARSSAINFVKNVSTPTLIVVGDRDGECPAPQSFEFWHALRDLHVPVQFVVYPNEGHGFSDPSDRRDSLVRAVDWFAHYMPSAP
ncbi:MAG TPA: S9 family peptidase [Terracidiphilus sp.]|jgi:dipeptidyl aminopeptidase/acylaminoacyl peptidase